VHVQPQQRIRSTSVQALCETYFNIRVFKKGTFRTAYDPVATVKKPSATILQQCGDTRQVDRDRVLNVDYH